MKKRDILKRRIRVCKTIGVVQIAVQLAFFVAVWNAHDMHRHLFNVLWYAFLFIQGGVLLILVKRISEAKDELDALNHTVDS